MRIVSLNAWGGAMFDPFAAWLPHCGADILCLQEVTRTPGLGGWTQFADGERNLPQRANLFEDVCSALPNHNGSFAASDAGPVVDAEGNTHRQEFGIAMFVYQQIAVTGHDTEFVHGSYVHHREWPVADRPRIAQTTRVTDPTTGGTVTVAHLHGLRDPTGKSDTPARLAQAKRLAELVTRARRPDDFAVLCGDLNLLPASETFTVLAAIGMIDLVGTADTRTSAYAKPVRHANYMLVSDPDKIANFEVQLTPEVSDHRALVLDL